MKTSTIINTRNCKTGIEQNTGYKSVLGKLISCAKFLQEINFSARIFEDS